MKKAMPKRKGVMNKLGKQLGIKMPKMGAKKLKPVKKGAGFMMKAKAGKGKKMGY